MEIFWLVQGFLALAVGELENSPLALTIRILLILLLVLFLALLLVRLTLHDELDFLLSLETMPVKAAKYLVCFHVHVVNAVAVDLGPGS